MVNHEPFGIPWWELLPLMSVKPSLTLQWAMLKRFLLGSSSRENWGQEPPDAFPSSCDTLEGVFSNFVHAIWSFEFWERCSVTASSLHEVLGAHLSGDLRTGNFPCRQFYKEILNFNTEIRCQKNGECLDCMVKCSVLFQLFLSESEWFSAVSVSFTAARSIVDMNFPSLVLELWRIFGDTHRAVHITPVSTFSVPCSCSFFYHWLGLASNCSISSF